MGDSRDRSIFDPVGVRHPVAAHHDISVLDLRLIDGKQAFIALASEAIFATTTTITLHIRGQLRTIRQGHEVISMSETGPEDEPLLCFKRYSRWTNV